jgi:uncharacterized alpha-E superfamily protein
MTHTLSSTAQRAYWLGRYLERAESTARLVSVNARLFYDLPKRLPLGWQPLVVITGNQESFVEFYDEPNEKNVTRFLINDARNPSSLLNSIEFARENVRTLRGIIPRQAVEYVNEMYLYAKDSLSEPLSRLRRSQSLIEIPKFTQRIEGFMSANMLHDEHWSFFRLGNYIERADMTSRIIDVGTDNMLADVVELEPYADIQWRSVLLSLDAAQSYNTEVQEPINQAAVLNFLLQNPRLPRSLAYALKSTRNGLRALPRNEQALRRVNRLRRKLREFNLTEADQIREFLDEVQIDLADLNRSISRTYFATATKRSRGKTIAGATEKKSANSRRAKKRSANKTA